MIAALAVFGAGQDVCTCGRVAVGGVELVVLVVEFFEGVPALLPVFPCGLDGELHALNRTNNIQRKNAEKEDEWREEYRCNTVFS